MARPLFIATIQRHDGDCAIACLASILQIPYEEVLVVAAQASPKVLTEGLFNNEIIEVARKFGRTLVEQSYEEIDFKRDIGILGGKLKSNEPNNEHAVVLSRGLVFDPDTKGEVWRARDYIKKHKMTKIDFLELED